MRLADITRSRDARLAFNCAACVAPTSNAATPGRASAHASATCAGGPLDFVGHLLEHVDDVPVARGEFRVAEGVGAVEAPVAAARDVLATVLARQQSAGQRAPREEAHAAVVRRGQVFVLGRALDQRVLELQRDRAGDAALVRDRRDLRRVPGRYVGQRVVADLSRANEVGQRLHDLVGGRRHVPEVQPVQVDVVGLQTRERRVQRAMHVLASVAAGVGVAGIEVPGELGRQHDAIAQPAFGDEAADDFFAAAPAVDVGRVEEIAAGFDVGLHQLTRDIVRDAPATGAEGHRAEGQRTHHEAGATERAVGGQIHRRIRSNGSRVTRIVVAP